MERFPEAIADTARSIRPILLIVLLAALIPFSGAAGAQRTIPRFHYTEPSAGIIGLMPVAPSISAARQAPALVNGFDGVAMGNPGVTPPDTQLAVGNDRLVEITNGSVAIYGKDGSIIAGGNGTTAVSLNNFCGGTCFDPKIVFDAYDDRFVAIALEGTTATASRLHVMISRTASPTDFSTSNWIKFDTPGGSTIGGNSGLADFPGLGVGQYSIIVTNNVFSDGGTGLGTRIRVFDKTAAYAGTSSYTDLLNDSSGGFTLQPAQPYGTLPDHTFYLVQRFNRTTLRLWTLTNVPGTPHAGVQTLITSNQGDCVATVPQLDTSKQLDGVCSFMANAVWRSDTVWGTLTGSDSSNSRNVVQWFAIDTSTPGAATITQHGSIDAGGGEYTFLPSIAVDAHGDAALTYTQSSVARYPELRYTIHFAGDGANTTDAPAVAKSSVGYYDDFSDNPERWGDYSAAVVDPSDGSFWIANEYVKVAATSAGNDGKWGTWIAHFQANKAPHADPGADQTVSLGATVSLDGRGSTDPDGTITAYRWTQTGGPAVTLSNASAAVAAFTAPSENATLVFRLTVTDNQGATDSAFTTLTVGSGVASASGGGGDYGPLPLLALLVLAAAKRLDRRKARHPRPSG